MKTSLEEFLLCWSAGILFNRETGLPSQTLSNTLGCLFKTNNAKLRRLKNTAGLKKTDATSTQVASFSGFLALRI